MLLFYANKLWQNQSLWRGFHTWSPDKPTDNQCLEKVLVHVVGWVDSISNSECKDNIDEAIWLWIDDKQDTAAGLIAIRTESIINWLITNDLIGEIATVNCVLDNINIADH